MFFLLPTKPPTPAEYTVIIIGSAVLLILAGLAGLVVALLAPAAKHALAIELAEAGLWCLGLGIVILILYWLFRQFVD